MCKYSLDIIKYKGLVPVDLTTKTADALLSHGPTLRYIQSQLLLPPKSKHTEDNYSANESEEAQNKRENELEAISKVESAMRSAHFYDLVGSHSGEDASETRILSEFRNEGVAPIQITVSDEQSCRSVTTFLECQTIYAKVDLSVRSASEVMWVMDAFFLSKAESNISQEEAIGKVICKFGDIQEAVSVSISKKRVVSDAPLNMPPAKKPKLSALSERGLLHLAEQLNESEESLENPSTVSEITKTYISDLISILAYRAASKREKAVSKKLSPANLSPDDMAPASPDSFFHCILRHYPQQFSSVAHLREMFVVYLEEQKQFVEVRAVLLYLYYVNDTYFHVIPLQTFVQYVTLFFHNNKRFFQSNIDLAIYSTNFNRLLGMCAMPDKPLDAIGIYMFCKWRSIHLTIFAGNKEYEGPVYSEENSHILLIYRGRNYFQCVAKGLYIDTKSTL